MKKTSTKKAINIFSALIIGCGASLGGASVMLAAAPPAAAAVAVIPEVTITNVTKPVVGDSPNTTVQVKESTTCTAGTVQWLFQGKNFTGKFEDGKSYTLSIPLTATGDNTFRENTKASIQLKGESDPLPANITLDDDARKATLTYTFRLPSSEIPVIEDDGESPEDGTEDDSQGSELPAEVFLDTERVYMIDGISEYDFLVEGNNDTDNITVTSSDENVATVALQDAGESRGAKYRITANRAGTATITVEYQGATATMDITVYPKGGSITLDTVNYRMAPGNIYDIGVTVTDGEGNILSGAQVQQMVADGTLRVTDSRTGSIVDLTQLPNGNFRVTGKNEGTCWITYEVIQQGKAVTHASIKMDVENGIRQGGVATRDTSWWAET